MALNSEKNSGKKQPKGDYTVGYGRPPKDHQYKKGQSGNPKGRPKRGRNLRPQMLDVYLDPVIMRVKGKRRRVPTILAIERDQVRKAFTDSRVAQAVFKRAAEFGVFDILREEESASLLVLTDEVLARLSTMALEELKRAISAVQAEQEDKPSTLH